MSPIFRFRKPSWKVTSPLKLGIGRVVEECAAKVGAESVDRLNTDVLNRVVDTATRVPHNETDRQHSPQPKRGPKLAATRGGPIRAHHPSPRLFSPYLSGKRAATRIAWETARSSEGLSCKGETDLECWREAVRQVEDIYDVLSRACQLWAERWKLQARSIVRMFMGRTKDFEDDEPEWSRLVELLDGLSRKVGTLSCQRPSESRCTASASYPRGLSSCRQPGTEICYSAGVGYCAICGTGETPTP